MGRPGTPVEILVSIDSIHKHNPKWKAPQIRQELQQQFKDVVPENRIPKERKIQMVVKRIDTKTHLASQNKLDRPWSLGSLVEWPYLKDIAPLFLMLQAEGGLTPHSGWTNRVALWAYRLSATVFRDLNLELMPSDDITKAEILKKIDSLLELAVMYSAWEQVWEDNSRPSPVDTRTLDAESADKMIEKYKQWSEPLLRARELKRNRRKGSKSK